MNAAFDEMKSNAATRELVDARRQLQRR